MATLVMYGGVSRRRQEMRACCSERIGWGSWMELDVGLMEAPVTEGWMTVVEVLLKLKVSLVECLEIEEVSGRRS